MSGRPQKVSKAAIGAVLDAVETLVRVTGVDRQALARLLSKRTWGSKPAKPRRKAKRRP